MLNTIHGLIKKRGEIAGQHKVAIKADLDAIDRALVLCGYQHDPKGIAPRGKYQQPFGRNELKMMTRDRLRQGAADDEGITRSTTQPSCSASQ